MMHWFKRYDDDGALIGIYSVGIVILCDKIEWVMEQDYKLYRGTALVATLDVYDHHIDKD